MFERKRLSSKQLLKAPLLSINQLGKQIGNAFIIAPHPDDEALGCGGIISYLTSQNIPIWVGFMTSGGASHPNSEKYPAAKLSQLREKEALRACKILGVPNSNVAFFRGPDSFLHKIDENKKNQMVSDLVEILLKNNIDSLFLPWRRDVHTDHLAVYKIGKKALEGADREIQIIEYPIWLWNNSEREDWPFEDEVETFRLDIRNVLSKKKEAIFAHKSQTTNLIADDAAGFVLTDELLTPFLQPYEIYFFPSQHHRSSLKKSYFDALYASNSDPWNFKKSDYEKEKYEKTDSFLENRNYKNGLELGCSIGVQTRYFARRCKNLLAVDISAEAINSAKGNNKDLTNVHFQQLDVLKEFPKDLFDFISMCEMGYYFNKKNLKSLFVNISENLMEKGIFLMVHWTSYVREYPLSGRQVHEQFAVFNTNMKHFKCISTYTHESYELQLWEKV
ncbi:PIG-L family deacetylase [Aequorivita capsosiphonis]|uniref:PIG-L family deacetylase n=1 Tax=Aequorivita capsosiphonis TaxID=487317 RepID=UPI0003FB1341|nr:PIG-L family deacetylase [Aequorivita capsosiphonis]